MNIYFTITSTQFGMLDWIMTQCTGAIINVLAFTCILWLITQCHGLLLEPLAYPSGPSLIKHSASFTIFIFIQSFEPSFQHILHDGLQSLWRTSACSIIHGAADWILFYFGKPKTILNYWILSVRLLHNSLLGMHGTLQFLDNSDQIKGSYTPFDTHDLEDFLSNLVPLGLDS